MTGPRPIFFGACVVCAGPPEHHAEFCERVRATMSTLAPVGWPSAGTVAAWGETKTTAQWVADPRCAVAYSTLRYRLRGGWEPEAAISRKRTSAA